MGHSLPCHRVLLVKKLRRKIPTGQHIGCNAIGSTVSMEMSRVWRQEFGKEEEASGCQVHASGQLQSSVLMKTLWCFTACPRSAQQRDHHAALSWSGTVTGQFFASLLNLDSRLQPIYQPKRHCYNAQKWSPRVPIIFSHNLARVVGPPMTAERVKWGQTKANPLSTWDLGGIHLAECRHL